MPVTAKLRELKIAPRKVRLVAELIRGKGVQEAQGLLRFTVKKACLPVLKLLDSAISNAKNNFNLNQSDLYVARIFVDEGHKQKKFRARARGTASFIKKRNSHVTIILDVLKNSSRKSQSSAMIPDKKEKSVTEKVKKTRIKTNIKSSYSEKKGNVGTKGTSKIFRRKAF